MRVDHEAAFTAMVDAGALGPRDAMSGREDYPPEARALLEQIEAQERAERKRVEDFVAEVSGPTGTSREFGDTIQLWDSLSRKAKTRGLEPSEQRTLDTVRLVAGLAFGKSGLISVLQAWYGPALERRTALAAVQGQTPPASE